MTFDSGSLSLSISHQANAQPANNIVNAPKRTPFMDTHQGSGNKDLKKRDVTRFEGRRAQPSHRLQTGGVFVPFSSTRMCGEHPFECGKNVTRGGGSLERVDMTGRGGGKGMDEGRGKRRGNQTTRGRRPLMVSNDVKRRNFSPEFETQTKINKTL